MSSQHYVLSAFSLDDKRHAAAKLAELRGTTIDELDVRWDRDAIDRAPTQAHRSLHPQHGWVTLVIAQDVADTIAAFIRGYCRAWQRAVVVTWASQE